MHATNAIMPEMPNHVNKKSTDLQRTITQDIKKLIDVCKASEKTAQEDRRKYDELEEQHFDVVEQLQQKNEQIEKLQGLLSAKDRLLTQQDRRVRALTQREDHFRRACQVMQPFIDSCKDSAQCSQKDATGDGNAERGNANKPMKVNHDIDFDTDTDHATGREAINTISEVKVELESDANSQDEPVRPPRVRHSDVWSSGLRTWVRFTPLYELLWCRESQQFVTIEKFQRSGTREEWFFLSYQMEQIRRMYRK